jgi:hypothetical protein
MSLAARAPAALACGAALWLATLAGRGQDAPPSPEAAEAARRLFREGAQLAEEGRWSEARERFRRALTVRPSPLLHYNLAVACQNAGYLVEAVDQYRSFLRIDADPANAARRAAAQRAIAAIEPVLARVLVGVPADEPLAVLAIDGRALPEGLWGVEVPLDPGEHFIDARSVRGSTAQRTFTVRDGETLSITLAWTPPATVARADVDGGASAHREAATISASLAPLPARTASAAPPGTIERVRRALEANARETDVTGARPWERTFVLFGALGTGSTAGMFALGFRWAARPWFQIEAQGGLGHPFGPGLLFFPAAFRAVWSYQFASSLSLGLGTNFTYLPQGTAPPPSGATCQPTGPFTPMWLVFGLANEFRVARGAGAVRFVIGGRWLVNNPELVSGLTARCTTPQTHIEPRDLFFDPPTLDHGRIPLLPWFAFDAGYAL